MPSVVPSSPRIERTRVEPPNPIPPPLPVVETPSVRLPVIPVAPSLVPGPAETPTVAPLSIPPVTAEPTEAPAATALPKPAPPRPPRQTPPPLPTANQSAPITPPRAPLSATQAGGPVTRREPSSNLPPGYPCSGRSSRVPRLLRRDKPGTIAPLSGLPTCPKGLIGCI